MVTFNIGKNNSSKSADMLEDISFKAERDIAKRIEEQIRIQHAHIDGSPVVISSVKSDIEGIVAVNESTKLLQPDGIVDDYKRIESESSSGLYSPEMHSTNIPIFVCACGAGFSVSGSSHGFEVYKISDYTPTDLREYSSKPEIDSYSKPIKY